MQGRLAVHWWWHLVVCLLVIQSEAMGGMRRPRIRRWAGAEGDSRGRRAGRDPSSSTAGDPSDPRAREAALARRAGRFTNRYRDLPALWSSLGLKRGAEVGVWKGEFASEVLQQMPGLESYTLVDSWRHLDDWKKPFNRGDREFTEIFNEAMRRTKDGPHGDKVRVVRGTSLEAAPQVEDGSLDFIYIDGDHTLKGIVIDMGVWWEKVESGGLICGDDFVGDFQHGPGHDPTLVKPYVEAFAVLHQLKLHDMGKEQFCFVKP